MVFSSLIFLFCFFPIFLICYFVPRKRSIRNLVLLLFSLAFYGYGEPIYVVLMLLSIIINYFVAIFMDKSNNHRKLYLVVAILFNLGLLGIFKYTNFFIDNINNLFNFNVSFLSISLPIGISFYTFQVLTYVIDVYRGKVDVQKSIINLGCYISAFPQLIAGPIVRYDTVNKELQDRMENLENFSIGVRRFIIGLGKKVIIANEMAYVADSIMQSNLNEVGFIGMIIGALCYTLQIYFDFSGYSDMAIGLGKMLGFNYLENFNLPYVAKSITDFWRRWHISLSTFFRDYVYIPLGGNRCSKLRHIFNILVVWMLTGMWHGASWNFILWGLYYGIILLIEKYIIKNILEKLPNIIRHIYTLVIVVVGWVIFYFTDLNTLILALKTLFGFNGLGNIDILMKLQIFKVRSIVVFILGVVISLGAFSSISKYKKLSEVLLIVIFILSIVGIVASSYNPFIYFRF